MPRGVMLSCTLIMFCHLHFCLLLSLVKILETPPPAAPHKVSGGGVSGAVPFPQMRKHVKHWHQGHALVENGLNFLFDYTGRKWLELFFDYISYKRDYHVRFTILLRTQLESSKYFIKISVYQLNNHFWGHMCLLVGSYVLISAY